MKGVALPSSNALKGSKGGLIKSKADNNDRSMSRNSMVQNPKQEANDIKQELGSNVRKKIQAAAEADIKQKKKELEEQRDVDQNSFNTNRKDGAQNTI